MAEFFIKAETMEVFTEVPEDEEGKFDLIHSEEELIEHFDKEALITLRTNIRGKEAATDKKKSLKKLAVECFKAATKPVKEEKEKAEPKERKPSRKGIIRGILEEKGTISLADLSEISGYPEDQVKKSIAGLKNKKRMKDPMNITFNKEDSTYTCHQD